MGCMDRLLPDCIQDYIEFLSRGKLLKIKWNCSLNPWLIDLKKIKFRLGCPWEKILKKIWSFLGQKALETVFVKTQDCLLSMLSKNLKKRFLQVLKRRFQKHTRLLKKRNLKSISHFLSGCSWKYFHKNLKFLVLEKKIFQIP